VKKLSLDQWKAIGDKVKRVDAQLLDITRAISHSVSVKLARKAVGLREKYLSTFKSLLEDEMFNQHPSMGSQDGFEVFYGKNPELEMDAQQIQSNFNAAINFALDVARYEGLTFLSQWREGDWDAIAKEFPQFKGIPQAAVQKSNNNTGYHDNIRGPEYYK